MIKNLTGYLTTTYIYIYLCFTFNSIFIIIQTFLNLSFSEISVDVLRWLCVLVPAYIAYHYQPRTQALFCAPCPLGKERRKEPGYEVDRLSAFYVIRIPYVRV